MFTDIFASCRWNELQEQCDMLKRPELFSEAKSMVLGSKEESTVSQYSNQFEKFRQWCVLNGFTKLPAKPSTVALYLVSLIQSDSNCGKSKLNQVFYAIKWAHETACLPDPCADSWLRLCLKGCIRKVSSPVCKKEPVTSKIILDLVERFASENCSLGDLRTVTLFILAFAGFFRINEVLQLTRGDFKFHATHCVIRVKKSKTDVLRQGNEVVIARTGKVTCPVKLLERYFSEADISDVSDHYVFRSVQVCSKAGQYKLRSQNKPLSYTRVRELLKEKLSLLGLDSSLFGTHSFRSGGATVCANNDTNERLWQKHGRWKSVTARDGYVVDSLESRLSVSLNLDV